MNVQKKEQWKYVEDSTAEKSLSVVLVISLGLIVMWKLKKKLWKAGVIVVVMLVNKCDNSEVVAWKELVLNKKNKIYEFGWLENLLVYQCRKT